MSFRKPQTPVYTFNIPSTDKPFKFRSFLVKDEKNLLIAQKTQDKLVMLETLKDVIRSCCLEELNVDKLGTFDIEYLFAQLRAVSIGELVDLYFRCDTCTDEKAVAEVTVDLTKLEVKKDPNHTNKIVLFDNVGVIMKYPSIETVKMIQQNDGSDIDLIFDTIINCIDCIFDEEEVFPVYEQNRAEVVEFIENLTSEQLERVYAFFATMPTLRVDVDYTCPVCQKEHHKYLEGIASFFY